jgi:hypothetical protein
LSEEIGTDELVSSPAITERSEGGKTEVEGETASDESAAEATTKKLSAIFEKDGVLGSKRVGGGEPSLRVIPFLVINVS